MLIRIFPNLRDFELANAAEMTGDKITGLISKEYDIDASLISILFQGFIVGSADTPKMYGASDDDDLGCFLSVEESKEITTGLSHIQSSFTSRMPLASVGNNLANVHRPTVSPSLPKPQTDEEYCRSQLQSGRFYGPMMEVVNHPALEGIFFEKLKNVDRRLYDVFYRNRELLHQNLNSLQQEPQPADSSPAFSLLTEQNNSDIMQIMEIKGIDFDAAMREYLNYGMDLERWAQEVFQ